MAIRKELLEELLKDCKGPEDLSGENGILKQLTKALVEQAMGAELSEHLGHEKHEVGEKPGANRRNGNSSKTVRTDRGPMTIEVPRDREGTFEPKIIEKHQREFAGFSDKILSMYARGMTNREMAEHLKEIYGADVSPLGIVHVVRSSLKFVPYKDRRTVAAGLRTIYSAATEEAALQALEGFRAEWDQKYPMIARSWESRWTEIAPFPAYAPEIRKVMYTTNAIEPLNYNIRKVTRNRQAFPSADVATKLVYMALQNISGKWRMPIREWSQALNQPAIEFTGRVPV